MYIHWESPIIPIHYERVSYRAGIDSAETGKFLRLLGIVF